MKHASPDDIGGIPAQLNRRSILRGTGAGAVALTALAAGVAMPTQSAEAQAAVSDIDILNFALNLEYLEAEYYQRAVTGQGLSSADVTGSGQTGSVTGGRKVHFASPIIEQYANEIAQDELDHVLFLRSVLGASAIAEPEINLRKSFNTLAQAAGLGESFDPYADENSFLLGGFIFEDVGVTAYHGAAALIQNKGYLTAAAGILAVEAYHASELRLLLLSRGFAPQTQAIANLRATLSAAQDDQGVLLNGAANIVPTDENGLAFSRTTRQVLNIVYGAVNATGGLFFPAGANGTIR